MKAIEFRIGNLLYDKEGRLCQVDQLNKGSWRAFAINGPLTTLPNQPIPLTEEWLEKLGFIKATIYPDTWNKNGLSFWWYGERPSVMLHRCEPKEFNYKFVHQVQNIYFAMTGDELSVGTK